MFTSYLPQQVSRSTENLILSEVKFLTTGTTPGGTALIHDNILGKVKTCTRDRELDQVYTGLNQGAGDIIHSPVLTVLLCKHNTDLSCYTLDQ